MGVSTVYASPGGGAFPQAHPGFRGEEPRRLGAEVTQGGDGAANSSELSGLCSWLLHPMSLLDVVWITLGLPTPGAMLASCHNAYPQRWWFHRGVARLFSGPEVTLTVSGFSLTSVDAPKTVGGVCRGGYGRVSRASVRG